MDCVWDDQEGRDATCFRGTMVRLQSPALNIPREVASDRDHRTRHLGYLGDSLVRVLQPLLVYMIIL